MVRYKSEGLVDAMNWKELIMLQKKRLKKNILFYIRNIFLYTSESVIRTTIFKKELPYYWNLLLDLKKHANQGESRQNTFPIIWVRDNCLKNILIQSAQQHISTVQQGNQHLMRTES